MDKEGQYIPSLDSKASSKKGWKDDSTVEAGRGYQG